VEATYSWCWAADSGGASASGLPTGVRRPAGFSFQTSTAARYGCALGWRCAQFELDGSRAGRDVGKPPTRRGSTFGNPADRGIARTADG
jgi:hypothetical protein